MVDTILVNGGMVFGFAHFPADGNDVQDGIVIADDFIGDSIGTGTTQFPNCYGRTASHEAGHWLGLFHPYECSDGSDNCCEGTNAGSCDTIGDFICDTWSQRGGHFGKPVPGTTKQYSKGL